MVGFFRTASRPSLHASGVLLPVPYGFVLVILACTDVVLSFNWCTSTALISIHHNSAVCTMSGRLSRLVVITLNTVALIALRVFVRICACQGYGVGQTPNVHISKSPPQT